ncbi:uncharacterized protein LOC118804902 [Colossoma macropomum]|uniref:uncharacterized protein LOC118804902 n=1 Tax=Colossoma macropomum TaxID=42526 RepID=UPI0018651084|nr:uncharacterized protein LOC118804902 [Colossoma macropomum]
MKSQVPTIDSDASSSSDNEEEISVYRRPSLFKLPQGAEVDLDYLSLGEPEIEDLLKSVTEPFMYGTGVDFCDQKDDDTPLLPKEHNDHKILVATGHNLEMDIINTTETESLPSESVDHSKSTDEKLNLVHEQKKNNSDMSTDEGECTSPEFTNPESEKLLQTSAGENCEIHPQPYPILSLKPLENWDLDQVLQSLKQHTGYCKDTREQGEPMLFRPFKYTDYANERPESNIMDQLAAFCEKQASKKVDTKMTSSSEEIHSKLQHPHISNLATTSRTDGWTVDCNDIAVDLRQKNYNSPTIYIDLRNHDHQTKPAPTSPSDQTSNHLLKQGLSTERVGNTQLEAARRNGMLTGKSSLLQKIRESNQIRTENCVRRTTPEDSVEPQKEKILGIREDQHSCKIPPPIKHLDKTSFPTTACEEAAAPLDKTLTSHKKEESDRVQKAQQMNKAQWQRYLKYLLTLRPQRSTNDKQSAAEMTDILYDTEGSHLSSVSTLPPNLQSSKCLLLTVTLSSPGVVAGRAQGKAHTVQSTTVRSHVYNSLIAWFLSLAVPNNFSMKDTMRNTRDTAPFWVAGLQQFCRDDGLVLYVCTVSPEESQPLYIKPRRKDMKKGWDLFHQRVSRFLSQTQLRTVVSWLPQLNHLLEQQAHPALISLPSASLDCFISISPDKEAVKRAFGVSPGFYWQTLETRDQICQRAEAVTSQQSHTEVVIALGCRPLFHDPLATHHTLQLLQSSGLDVCGLRFTYPSEELLANTAVHVTGGHGWEYSHQPVLALAIRGTYASSIWQEITGPSDPHLAQKTDPVSVSALYCHDQDQPLLLYPRMASRVHLGLSVWFGGRVPKTGLMVTEQKQSCSGKKDRAFNTETSSTAALCATVKGDVFLLVSPVVPPCCYGYVLSVCAKRGFHLMGLQRVQISSKRASSLGLTSVQMSAFCHAPTVFLDGELYSHSLVLLLRKENALRHCGSLSTGLMNEFALKGLVGLLRARLASDVRLAPDLCFHAVPYTENLLNFLGGLMWTLPDFSHVILSNHRYPSYSEMEQIVILTLTGHNVMEEGISLLHNVISGDVAGGAGEERFELLALKWLPTLSLRQAQELSPFEVGDRLWQSSVASLASSPALVCALRRLQAFGTLRRLLPQDYPGNLSALMSPTPEMAFRQAALFFAEAELIPDHSSRTMLKFLPPLSTGSKSQSFYSCMTEGPQPLLTLALFKPGVWRHCLGKILSKIQQNGFTLVGLRVLVLDSKMADVLTAAQEHQDHSKKKSELKYLGSSPALALCLQRVNAVKRLLELLGPEDPAEDQHLWRASYSTDTVHNGIYGSFSYQKAVQDIKMIFSDGLCCSETSIIKHEQIPCLSSDPVASLERQQSHTITVIAKNKRSQSVIEESGSIGGKAFLGFTLSCPCQSA